MGFQPYKENRHEYWRSIDNGEIIRKWGFLNTIVAINVYLITSYKVAFYGFLSNWLTKFLKTINNSSWVSTNQPRHITVSNIFGFQNKRAEGSLERMGVCGPSKTLKKIISPGNSVSSFFCQQHSHGQSPFSFAFCQLGKLWILER